MDLLSHIASWLRENEATISAVAAILATAAILFNGFRFLLRRRAEPTLEPAPEEDLCHVRINSEYGELLFGPIARRGEA